MPPHKKTPRASGANAEDACSISRRGRPGNNGQLPHDPEAEAAVLGAMIHDYGDRIEDAAAIVGADDFYEHKHRALFQVMLDLYRQDNRLDGVSLLSYLREKNLETEVGGIGYFTELFDSVPSSGAIEHYARIVLRSAQQRRLLDLLERSKAEAAFSDPGEVVAHLIEQAPTITTATSTTPISFSQLQSRHPRLADAIIDGIVRQGETANIIAPTKVGKSWLAYDIGLSINTGRRWLDAFQCAAGPVLLIDNELHPATIAHRIPKVADALGIAADRYAKDLDVISLRGRGVSLPGLRP